ncbi:MAG: Spy/CpxP family protein refolding chaperone [Bryobacteraceae bacterium]
MQNRIISISLLAVVSAGLLVSQTTTNTPPSQPTPAQMTAHQVTRLTTLLSLNAEQQTQATAIFTTEQAALSTLSPSMQAAHKALQAAVKTQDSAAITALAAQIGTLTTQEVQARATAQGAFYATLSTDQQTKYDQLQPGPWGFGGHGGSGGPGGRGAGGPHP